MSRIKNYYHDLFEWQHLCENNDRMEMPYWLLEHYNMSEFDATAMGIRVQSLAPLDDYTDEEKNYFYFLQNKYDNEKLNEEFEKLKPGERMVIGISVDEHGNHYEEYLTKE